MKKIYEMPAIELKKFDVEDIITASTGLISDEDFKSNAVLTVSGEKKSVTAVANWNSVWNSYLGI